MQKDFENWNTLKQHLHSDGVHCFYRAREIWWCSLGINIGSEEDGKGAQAERPIPILRGFNKELCLAVPLSASTKKNPYYVPAGDIDGKPASALISHVRPIDTKRLINRIGYIDQSVFDKIKQATKDML